MKTNIHFNIITLIIGLLISKFSLANIFTDAIKQAKLIEVTKSIKVSSSDITSIVNDPALSLFQKQSILVLSKLGCLTTSDVNSIEQLQILTNCELLQPLSIKHPDVPLILSDTLNQLLKDDVIQGYNIKAAEQITTINSGKNVLLYGHSSMAHAKQLITLLTVKGVDFNWKLIAKSSAFNIREGWNDAQLNESNTTIRTAKEYDILLSFADKDNLAKFMPLINNYAKKDNDDETGLIINAWWQPFYRSFHPRLMYKEVKRISIRTDEFVASTIILSSDLDKTLQKINHNILHSNTSVETEKLWVNPAFFRYLSGEFQ